MKISLAKPSNAQLLSELILRVTLPFRFIDFTDDGWERSITLNSTTEVASRINNQDNFSLCAFADDSLVGTIAVNRYQVITQLFVDSNYRGQGVARGLWLEARRICRLAGFDHYYYVKSSTYAVPVYQRFGFSICGKRQIDKGCWFIPMEIEFHH